MVAGARTRFPDAGWRIRQFDNAAPSLQTLLDRMTVFMTLVGLTALVVGGVGVGNAVSSYLAGKTETIATLKCLGASRREVFATYLAEILGARRLRHRAGLGRWRGRALCRGAAAAGGAAGDGAARALSRAALRGRPLRPAHYARLRAVAPGRGRGSRARQPLPRQGRAAPWPAAENDDRRSRQHSAYFSPRSPSSPRPTAPRRRGRCWAR